MQLAHSHNKQGQVLEGFWRLLMRWWFLIFQRQRYNQLVLEHMNGCPVLVLPNVFHPKLFFSSEFLIEQLNDQLIPPGCSVLDIGSGSGVGAIAAAHWAQHVVAVDIDPDAVRCTCINVLLNQVEDRVKAYQGDLFAPVAGQRFNVVLFNPAFFYKLPYGTRDRQECDIDTVKRFAANLNAYLLPDGYALVALSSMADLEAVLEAFSLHGLRVEVITRCDLISEVVTLYRLTLPVR